jgi:hypothetical protein
VRGRSIQNAVEDETFQPLLFVSAKSPQKSGSAGGYLLANTIPFIPLSHLHQDSPNRRAPTAMTDIEQCNQSTPL